MTADALLSQPEAQEPEQRPLLLPRSTSDQTQSSLDTGAKDSIKNPEHEHGDAALEHYAFSMLRLVAVMLNFLVCGVVVTGIGVLLPDISTFYHLTDGTTALIFPTGVTGYVCASVFADHVHGHLGRRGIAFLSPAFRFLAMGILATGPLFSIALTGYFLMGFGTGLSDAGFCAWAANVPYASVVQGFMHGSYSVGSILGPLLANLMLKNVHEWYEFYRMTGVLLLVELVVLVLAFRLDHGVSRSKSPKEQELELQQTGHLKTNNALRHRATWICGAFCFFYVGLEACFTDWIAVFMQRARHTDPTTSSLATSMFWIGMASGRFILGPLSGFISIKLAVAGYLVVLMVLQVLFRILTTGTTHANVTASLVLLVGSGLVCGPMFPSAILLLSSKLPVPPAAQVGAVAAVSALGQIGAGIAPYAVGVVADRLGIQQLLNVIGALAALTLVVWAVFATLPEKANLKKPDSEVQVRRSGSPDRESAEDELERKRVYRAV
ncbi:hypothetical protein HRR83_000890 [Exophiala dermatitidis]|uniref:Major facilitator superfamily (MFS) profile domain-containing protein n=1 Tax=Exophiala dermatitidis TaxID=5970 RepID=A0AAN6IYR0_EXODE|nr:hypothetical protein HRR74_000894 [Exophiala dermatitidis]KAJ4528772.1 hypothetical protein HRR73_001395 [Exophiala dermatitidis]KAJ4530158.1 hypothetical protein HRR76_009391 [Exophiala dermatitidis]KAJ4558924.1 hypothetical protein HRR77_000893 [Exophiala dermatitidis]KAJ4581054.1 hypothetical protein HRR79_000105 [Exophiala dermatitidis]